MFESQLLLGRTDRFAETRITSVRASYCSSSCAVEIQFPHGYPRLFYPISAWKARTAAGANIADSFWAGNNIRCL